MNKNHWTTPPVGTSYDREENVINPKGTTPDWNQGVYQTANLYPDDMYKRSKRFKKSDEEVTEEMDNEGYLYSKGWEYVDTISGYRYWTHPQYAATFTTDEALKRSGEMDQTQKAVNDSYYLKNPYEDKTNNLEYWKLKYCEKSDEAERLRKTIFEYKGELEALREENKKKEENVTDLKNEMRRRKASLSDDELNLENVREYNFNKEYEQKIKELEQQIKEKDAEIENWQQLYSNQAQAFPQHDQEVKELKNRNHYLQVELDNYKILMNENKDLEESVDRAREIFNTALSNATQDDLRAFQDVLDTHAADKVMEDTEDKIEPFERTTENQAEPCIMKPVKGIERLNNYSPNLNLDEQRKEYEFEKELENFKQARKELLEVLAEAKEWLNRLQDTGGDNPLDESNTIKLEGEDAKRFVDRIENPPEPNENLKNLKEKARIYPGSAIPDPNGGYYTLEDFMEDIQNELPTMDYFSTPYDEGSKDDLLDRISHLSAMYSRFGYGARGDEWGKGYFRGIMDEKEKIKEEPSDELKEATSDLLRMILRNDLNRRNTEGSLEKQKIYTHEMYHANLRLQSKLDKAREFLSSWEDGDRSLDDEGTLWDTFNDFLEGKYDPRSGEWVESS